MAFEQAAKFVVEELVIRDNGAITFPDSTTQTTAYVAAPSTLEPKYGQAGRVNTFDTIEIGAKDVYQSTGLTATLNSLNSGVSLGEDDEFGLKNTSGETRIFDVFGSIDMGATGEATALGIKLALNGVEIDETECRAVSLDSRPGKLVTAWLLELEPDDEVSLMVANLTNANNISFSRGRIIARTV